MHTYRVFEVLDEKEFYTGKTVLLAYPADREAVVAAIFELYGFTQYKTYYYIGRNTQDLISIRYNYVDGYKETWVLRRGLSITPR
jgi:hypothetical protein